MSEATAKELRWVVGALCFAALIGLALAIKDASFGSFLAFIGQLVFVMIFAVAVRRRGKTDQSAS